MSRLLKAWSLDYARSCALSLIAPAIVLPLLALLVLVLTALACMPGGGETLPIPSPPTHPPAPADTPIPTESPPPTETPKPSPTTDTGIGARVSQWATSATASSEYGNPEWAASQATGAPDTLECGDYATAWAAAEPDTVEWIELTYDFPVLPTQVNVIQTYSPDQVVKVELIDLGGTYHEIYVGEPADRGECPYTLSVPVENPRYQAMGVRVTIDQTVLSMSWNEIDAVELVGVPEHPIMEGE